jgi:hypothetical protein
LASSFALWQVSLACAPNCEDIADLDPSEETNAGLISERGVAGFVGQGASRRSPVDISPW